MLDAYKILGCSPTDSIKAIKEAYRELVKEYHPDCVRAVGGSPELIRQADQEFRTLDQAYRSLLSLAGAVAS